MIEQKIKSKRSLWQIAWWVLCCVSLYALLLRLTWHTQFFQHLVIIPWVSLVTFYVLYVYQAKKQKKQKP